MALTNVCAPHSAPLRAGMRAVSPIQRTKKRIWGNFVAPHTPTAYPIHVSVPEERIPTRGHFLALIFVGLSPFRNIQEV